jgi:hypothetical protein
MIAMLALASCKGAEQVCDPTDPLCGGGGGATIANIAVTSPVDTVMAVGRSVTMTAAATNSTGGPVSTTFTWNSTTPATATVTNAGLVAAQATGTTTIQALSSGVTGSLQIRAVNANLPAVTLLMGDNLRQALATALSGTPASTLSGLLTTCQGHVTSGHVRALNTCLAAAVNVTAPGGNDQALLGVLDLFFQHAQRQLGL